MRNFLIIILLSSLLIAMTYKQNSDSKILASAKNYVSKKYTLKMPQKNFFLKASILNIKDNYALLEATTLYEDGSIISTEYIEDITFLLCFKKDKSGWRILYDLSRNDVPSSTELHAIKKEFPSDFPKELLPKYWKKKLNP